MASAELPLEPTDSASLACGSAMGSSDRRSMERAAMDGRDFPGVTGLFPFLIHGVGCIGEISRAVLADVFPKIIVPRRLVGRGVFVAAFTFYECWCIHGRLVIRKRMNKS